MMARRVMVCSEQTKRRSGSHMKVKDSERLLTPVGCYQRYLICSTGVNVTVEQGLICVQVSAKAGKKEHSRAGNETSALPRLETPAS